MLWVETGSMPAVVTLSEFKIWKEFEYHKIYSAQLNREANRSWEKIFSGERIKKGE